MAQSYNRLSDEELIMRLRDGEEPIMDYIIDKYKNMVRSKAKSMYILGADRDDLLQEGMIGLFKAVRDYDFGRDASFSTFADLCVTRQMYTAVQAARRQKHSFLNAYVSLSADAGSDQEDDQEAQLINALASRADRNPEEMLIDRENLERLEDYLNRELSPFEKQILELYLTGMSYAEIARVLGKSEKSTDNALQRIKSKIKKMK